MPELRSKAGYVISIIGGASGLLVRRWLEDVAFLFCAFIVPFAGLQRCCAVLSGFQALVSWLAGCGVAAVFLSVLAVFLPEVGVAAKGGCLSDRFVVCRW